MKRSAALTLLFAAGLAVTVGCPPQREVEDVDISLDPIDVDAGMDTSGNVTTGAMTPGGNVTTGAMTPGGNVTTGADMPAVTEVPE